MVYICILKQNIMITITELLGHTFKVEHRHYFTEGNTNEVESYEIGVYDKINDTPLYKINRGTKEEWDLNLMIIRLFEEECINDTQAEHLLTAIENYGQKRFEKGGNDDY